MYWDNINSNTITVAHVGGYINYPHMTSTVPEGYNCDPLQPTPVLFMGSCDLDGPIDDTNQSWARMLHKTLPGPVPYIALAKLSAGFASFPRRLFTYCAKFGAPTHLYAVIPRAVAIEVPISTGELVSVSNRETFANWLKRHEQISSDDYDCLIKASHFCQSQMSNHAYQLYQFEQSAAFIETICKANNITFQWTVNLSRSAIRYYAGYLEMFLQNCPWMQSTFVGVPVAVDFHNDGSMSNVSQYAIKAVFTDPQRQSKMDIQLRLARNLILANAT